MSNKIFNLIDFSPIGFKKINYPVQYCCICRGYLTDVCSICMENKSDVCDVINTDNNYYHHHCFAIQKQNKKNKQ